MTEQGDDPAQVLVDARGVRCPIPVIRLAAAMRDPQVVIVTVLATDPAARADIPAWCRMRGQHLDSVTEQDGHTQFVVRAALSTDSPST